MTPMWLSWFACASEGMLTDPEWWTPIADDGINDVDAPPCEVWWIEEGVVEVRTDLCPRFSVAQPVPRRLSAGDRLGGGVQWQALDAEEPAEAHLVLLVDGERVFERRPRIPGPGATVTWEAPLLHDVPAGAPIVWHLHNHGSNSYRLGDVGWTRASHTSSTLSDEDVVGRP